MAEKKHGHKQTTAERGRDAENAASFFLKGKGYTIVERNYRWGKAEVDIIARQGGTLVFVEVKMRSGTAFGNPEEFVDAAKENRLMEAAEHYLAENDLECALRFDIVGILLLHGKRYFTHFEDAF